MRRGTYLNGRYNTYEEKTAAHKAVQRASQKKELIPLPCVECGSPYTSAHHESYLEKDWLNVTWMCDSHHFRHHAKLERERLDGVACLRGLALNRKKLGKS